MTIQRPLKPLSELPPGASRFHQTITSANEHSSAALHRNPRAVCKKAFLVALAAQLLLASGPAVLASPFTPLNGAQSRPFYVIAHNPNTLSEVDDALNSGCNTLEPDITEITCGNQEVLIDFDPDGGGIPDCGELRLLAWCDHVNQIAQTNTTFALVLFDIKKWAAKGEIGLGSGDPLQVKINATNILKAAREHLNANGVNLNVIYSTAYTDYGGILAEILKAPLTPREGVNIDMEDDPWKVVKFFNDLGYFGSIGYGDGTAGPGPNLPRIMDRAAYLRASVGFPKVITDVFLISQASSMDFFIDAGVDGMIVTDASQQQALDIVNNVHEEVHLATREDNPFEPLNEAYAVQVHTDNYFDSGTDSLVKFTLNGCRGSSTIFYNSGDIYPGYDTGRLHYGHDDWMTIPSKDLGELQSITVENLGPDVPGAGWDLTEVHVSSAHYIGPNWFVNGLPSREYSATFSGTIKVGNKVPLKLAPNFALPLPTIQCPAPVIVPNDLDQCGAIVNFAPVVSGLCDNVTAVCVPPSGSFFPVGTTPVSCSASNASGQADCSFTVTVINTQPPTIQCPAPITVANDPDQCGAVVTFAPVVSGPCNDVVAVCNPPSGTLFPIGQTAVACYAHSLSGPDSLPCFFIVTVQDTQPPVITCPAPLVIDATGQAGAVATFAPTVADNCPGATVTCVPPSGSVFAIGDTTVNCTATDASSNSSSCSFNLHVKGAAEQTADLLAAVASLNLSKPGVKNALLFQLNATLASLQKNNLVAACGALQSFINLVDGQRNNTISSSDADILIAAASQIRAVIGCKP